MIRIGKNTLILTCLVSSVLLSGCLSLLRGIINSPYQTTTQNQFQQPYQQPYQQMNYQQGTFNQQGSLTQGAFGQKQDQNKQNSFPPGYSASGYTPGYPAQKKPSYQGWKDPDLAVGEW